MSRPRLAVLDYGIGNLRSAQRALSHCGADALLTADAGVVDDADAVVLPGVGAFGACMRALRTAGLERVVHDAIASGRPFLGICVGMQMLFDHSEEDDGAAAGLGVLAGAVRWIPAGEPRPQMQWNRVVPLVADEPVFAGLADGAWMYFVHSLHAVPDDPSTVVATCDYGATITAAVRRDNIVATQFHPEKSGRDGLALLANFVALAGRHAAGGDGVPGVVAPGGGR